MKQRVLALIVIAAVVIVLGQRAMGTTDGVTDATGDASDPRADITFAGATYQDDEIALGVAVATPTNPDTDPNWENSTGIVWALDTNNDTTADFTASYLGGGAGVTTPNSQTLLCQGQRVYNANDSVQYFLKFPAACIGNPTSLRFVVSMIYKTASITATDAAPNNQQFCCTVTETITPSTSSSSSSSTSSSSTTSTTLPPVVPGAQITTGAGQGGAPHIRSFDSNGSPSSVSFYAYDPSFSGGAPVARGDLTGDGVDEIVVGSGVNGNAYNVFAANGAPLFGGNPFGSAFHGGIEVAVGDVTGDGANEIIVAAGPGGGPHVKVLSANGTPLGVGFYAYGANFTGGVHVAVGRIAGEGKSQIVTGAGAGGAPHVRAFDADGNPVGPGFYAYGQNFPGGVYVAVADGKVVTGAGAGGAPHVRSFDVNGAPGVSFYAYPEAFPGGVRVATADLGGAAGREIITGAGPGRSPHVRVFSANGAPTATSFYAYGPAFGGGVYVAGSPR